MRPRLRPTPRGLVAALCALSAACGAGTPGGGSDAGGCQPTAPENTVSTCSDGADNDCDGTLDCLDLGCRDNPEVTACASAGPDAGCAQTGEENDNSTCADGIDNDCDGYLDCVDFSCSRNPAVTACRPACVPTGTESTDALCADGRSWSGSLSNECRGSASSCSSYSSDYGCNSQNGCRWNEGCWGEPTACSGFTTSASCAGQPGCYWQ